MTADEVSIIIEKIHKLEKIWKDKYIYLEKEVHTLSTINVKRYVLWARFDGCIEFGKQTIDSFKAFGAGTSCLKSWGYISDRFSKDDLQYFKKLIIDLKNQLDLKIILEKNNHQIELATRDLKLKEMQFLLDLLNCFDDLSKEEEKQYDLYRVFTFNSVKYQIKVVDDSEYDFVDGTMLPYPFVTKDGERSSNRQLYSMSKGKDKGDSYLGRISETLLKELIECDFIFEVEKILDREGITKNEQKL